MTKLLAHLISFPHLQALIRGLTIYQHRFDDDIPLPAHISCLASVLSLLPNIMKLVFPGGNTEDIETRSYLDLIPNVLALVELRLDIYSIETFEHLFNILGGTNVKQVSLSGVGGPPPEIATHKVWHLPSLEFIRFGVVGLEKEFHDCLMHHFDLPNLKQCEIVTEFMDDTRRWQNLLLRGFPPLQLFKLELAEGFIFGFGDDLQDAEVTEENTYRPLPLGGLQFQHVHLKVYPDTFDQTRKFIEWWSSTFRALADSNATIHFTELTLTFLDIELYPEIYTLEEAWKSLDDSLAHTMFSGVRNIHIERSSWQGGLITPEAYHPLLADRMHLLLPRLASRGVLRLD
ncbi:hypothetical protein BDZ89DRAFT_1047820 [Hymenopellis radicata]|nr:hypothetical protein BDZ89DRAFT_1047820 [Hymenopellis radicata]